MPPNPTPKNVLGDPLAPCCTDPMTGFYRNGKCETGPTDHGLHIVCAEMTETFLEFSKTRGNDLSTPRPEYNFPGLKPGDCWCLCVTRWKEALDAAPDHDPDGDLGFVPKIKLAATHISALEFVDLNDLKSHALA